MSVALRIVAALVLLAPLARPAAPEAARPTAAELEREMARLVNLEREARGLPPLTLEPSLAAVARAHSRRMAAAGAISHEAGGRSVEERIGEAVPGACRFGENVARHYSIDYALGDLLGSPGHRGNLLSEEFTLLGVGVAFGEDGFLYITQDFTRRCASRSRRR